MHSCVCVRVSNMLGCIRNHQYPSTPQVHVYTCTCAHIFKRYWHRHTLLISIIVLACMKMCKSTFAHDVRRHTSEVVTRNGHCWWWWWCWWCWCALTTWLTQQHCCRHCACYFERREQHEGDGAKHSDHNDVTGLVISEQRVCIWDDPYCAFDCPGRGANHAHRLALHPVYFKCLFAVR